MFAIQYHLETDMQSEVYYRINAADKILKKEKKIATNNPEVVMQGYL